MVARDNGACVACGRTVALTTQHRHNRGQGGAGSRGQADSERPSNRCTLCVDCNRALEQDARFAETGRRHGWKLVGDEDPTKVAIYVVMFREWRLLDDEGSYRIVDGRDPDEQEWRAAA